MSGTDYTKTPNLGLYKPITDMDADQWGTHWNANADTLDATVKAIDTKVPVASTTLPIMDGVAAVGSLSTYAKADHIHPSDTAKLTDAPNDGKAYSRRNALWTSNPFYDAKGNVGISTVPPPNAAAANSLGASSPGGWLFGWGVTANNFAYNSYYDGTVWRYQNDGLATQMQGGSNYIWQFAPTGLKDAVATLTTKMSLNSNGDLTTSGVVAATNGMQINGASDPRLTFTNNGGAADQKKVDIYASTTQFSMQFVNDAFNAGTGFFQALRPGTGYGVAAVSLTAPSIFLNGLTSVSSQLAIETIITGGGFLLYAEPSNGARHIRFTTDYWRLTWATNGSLVYYNPTGSALWFCDASGNTHTMVDEFVGGTLWVNSGIFAVAPGYYLQRSGADGAWRFVENNVTNLTLDAVGNLTAKASLLADGGQMHIGPAGSGRICQMSPGWYWDWHIGSGALVWMNPNRGQQWMIRNDGICYNDWSTVGGHGPFQDYSDERSKADIQPSTAGLDEVLRLSPIRFRRIRRILEKPVTDEREDVGFSAQQVRRVIPEAVSEAGFTLPEGGGGMDSDAPTLGLSTTAIIAAMVNSIKELHAEIQALKGQRA
jgi:hypothetical protein